MDKFLSDLFCDDKNEKKHKNNHQCEKGKHCHPGHPGHRGPRGPTGATGPTGPAGPLVTFESNSGNSSGLEPGSIGTYRFSGSNLNNLSIGVLITINNNTTQTSSIEITNVETIYFKIIDISFVTENIADISILNMGNGTARWGVNASCVLIGPMGPQGVTGPDGATGPTGPTGPAGVPGPINYVSGRAILPGGLTNQVIINVPGLGTSDSPAIILNFYSGTNNYTPANNSIQFQIIKDGIKIISTSIITLNVHYFIGTLKVPTI